MTNAELEAAFRPILNRILRGDYEGAVARCSMSRCTAEDLRRVVMEYPATFIEPPADAYVELNAVEVTVANEPTWDVCIPLWTREEGRSDLTLTVWIIDVGGRLTVELLSLHVP